MYRRRPRELPPIISAQGLCKRYGVAPLFQGIFVHCYKAECFAEKAKLMLFAMDKESMPEN